jgi:hypothetical protein
MARYFESAAVGCSIGMLNTSKGPTYPPPCFPDMLNADSMG